MPVIINFPDSYQSVGVTDDEIKQMRDCEKQTNISHVDDRIEIPVLIQQDGIAEHLKSMSCMLSYVIILLCLAIIFELMNAIYNAFNIIHTILFIYHIINYIVIIGFVSVIINAISTERIPTTQNYQKYKGVNIIVNVLTIGSPIGIFSALIIGYIRPIFFPIVVIITDVMLICIQQITMRSYLRSMQIHITQLAIEMP